MPRKLDTRKEKRIIDAALEIFGEQGFRRTTIKDIARRSGIAAGSIYTYFSDKETLFLACVDESWTQFLAGMEKFSKSELPIEKKYIWFFDYGFDLLKKVHPLIRGMYSELNRRKLFQAQMDRLCELMEATFAEDDRAGLFVEGDNRENRQFIIRVIVGGILFDTSLTTKDELDDKIEQLKHQLKSAFLVRYSVDKVS